MAMASHSQDLRQELVAQALAFRRALDQAGDIDKRDGGWDCLGRFEEIAERRQSLIGNLNDAGVGLDGGEGGNWQPARRRASGR